MRSPDPLDRRVMLITRTWVGALNCVAFSFAVLPDALGWGMLAGVFQMMPVQGGRAHRVRHRREPVGEWLGAQGARHGGVHGAPISDRRHGGLGHPAGGRLMRECGGHMHRCGVQGRAARRVVPVAQSGTRGHRQRCSNAPAYRNVPRHHDAGPMPIAMRCAPHRLAAGYAVDPRVAGRFEAPCRTTAQPCAQA